MTRFAPVCIPNYEMIALAGDGIALYQTSWASVFPYEKRIQQLKRLGVYLIQDFMHPTNNAVGMVTANLSEHIGAALSFMPNEVVIPDSLRNGPNTLAMAKEFLDKAPQGSFKYMFVPQGDCVSDWLDCLEKAVSTFGPLFHVVGVPKHLERFCQRLDLVNAIPSGYEVHLLGVWSGIKEFAHHPRVRSWDSTFPIAVAQDFHLVAQDFVTLEYLENMKKCDYDPRIPVDMNIALEATALAMEALHG